MARLKRYTLQELMAECDLSSPRGAEDQAWLDMFPVGLEVEGFDSAECSARLLDARSSDGAHDSISE